MEKNNNEKYFILAAILGGCVLVSYLVFVVVRSGTHDTAFAAICFFIVAALLCIGSYHIFIKLYNMVPKNERERLKAERKAEEECKRQLTEVQENEIAQPEPQQPNIVVQNTIVNQHAIVNEVNTAVVNQVVNDIKNENVNVAPMEVNVKTPDIHVEPTPVTVEAPVVNVDTSHPIVVESQEEIPDFDTTIDEGTYRESIAAHQLSRQQKKVETAQTIMEYLTKVVSPYIVKDDFQQLCEEVMAWINDPEYLPQKGIKVKEGFTTLDARHVIYNISVRLGKSHGAHRRSLFGKRLFAETCKELEENSFYSNIKENPLGGNIKLDEPTKGSIAFHYDSKDKN